MIKINGNESNETTQSNPIQTNSIQFSFVQLKLRYKTQLKNSIGIFLSLLGIMILIFTLFSYTGTKTFGSANSKWITKQ